MCLSGCAKYSAECELVIMPRLLKASNSALDTPAEQVRIYAFYNLGKYKGDVEKWRPASYADASEGVVSRNSNPDDFRIYNLMAEQSDEGDDTYVRLVLSSSPVMLVAVDPVNRFYGWRVFEYMIPMPQVYMPVRFQIWKPTTDLPVYEDLLWKMTGEKFDRQQSN